jgi:O-antigen ligase
VTRILLFLLFFVLLASRTLGFETSLAPGLSIKNAFLYVIFLVIAIEAALARNRHFELPSVVIPYALCILYAIFTWITVILVIDYPGYSMVGSLMFLKSGLVDHLIVFLVFFYGTLTAKDSHWLMKMMIWTVIAGNAISVIDAFNLPDLGLIDEREDGRIGGVIGESNQYAAFLALFTPGAIALAITEQGWRRALAFLGVGASGLALLMTVSRGGILGAVAGGVLALIFLRRFVSGKAVVWSFAGLFASAIVGVAVLFVAGYGEVLQHRLIGLSTAGTTHEISSGRTYIWSRTLLQMMDSPVTLILGFGWESYRAFSITGFSPHNSYLKIFFELGAIGLLLVLLSFANILRIARIGLQNAQSEYSALLFAFIFGMFGILVAIFFVDLYAPWLFIWAFTGVAMRLAISQVESGISRDEGLAVAGAASRLRIAHLG